MKQEINKGNILGYLEAWTDFDDKVIKEEGEAYKVILSSGNKSVTITTPYEVGEYFLDFTVGCNPYFSDWYEIMDDSLSDFMSYTKDVAGNFLFNEVRVVKKGWWFLKVDELQYFNNGSWFSVFQEKHNNSSKKDAVNRASS